MNNDEYGVFTDPHLRRSTSSQLNSLCHIVEHVLPGLAASIYRLTPQSRLVQCAGPSIPKSMRPVFQEIPIGKDIGSCGTAAWSGNQIRVNNIAVDKRWDAYRALPLKNGFTACWSQPVRTDDRYIVGTVGFYFSKPPLSSGQAIQMLHHVSNVASRLMKTQSNYVATETRFNTLRMRLANVIEALGFNLVSLEQHTRSETSRNSVSYLASKNLVIGRLLCRMMRDLQHMDFSPKDRNELSSLVGFAMQDVGRYTEISCNFSQVCHEQFRFTSTLAFENLLFWACIWAAGGISSFSKSEFVEAQIQQTNGMAKIRFINQSGKTLIQQNSADDILSDYLREISVMLGFTLEFSRNLEQRTIDIAVPFS